MSVTDVVFDIGDYVEITQNRRGTIKYEGNIKFVGYIVGIELDETIPGGTDGTLLGVRYFKCRKKRATFVKISKIKSIIKPRSTQNRIRKALHLPFTNNSSNTSKKKAKKQKQSKIKKKKTSKQSKHKTLTTKQKKKNSKKPKKKFAFSNVPSLVTDDSNSSTGSTGSSGSSKDEIKPSFHSSASAGSASLVSKQKSKKKEKLSKRSEDTTSITTASPIAPPRTPRPRLLQRKRATSSLSREREKFLSKQKEGKAAKSPITLRRQRSNKKISPKSEMTDINDKLKYNLKLLCALGPVRKRQEALKECAALLSDKQLLTNNNSQIAVFSFEKPTKTRTNHKCAQMLDSLTIKYFVDSFKKAFWKQLQDKKVSIQKEIINLLHIVIKNHWLYIKKYLNFYLKKLLLYFEKNDIKSTHKFVSPVIKTMIKSVTPSDDKVIIVHIMCELIQFAIKSHSKMVKKHCWKYIGLLLKKQIKYRQELPSASSSPSYAIGGNRNYSFSKSPKNMLDILQSGLKKGISDSDKATQAAAMSVLTMFSFLDETRAERLISRMSGTLMRQYNISKKQHRLSSISSPRASILTSPKNSLSSPRSKSLQSPKIARRMLKIKKKRKEIKKKAAIVIKPSVEKKEFAFVGFSLELDTKGQNNADEAYKAYKPYKEAEQDVICVLSDDMSSTDTESYSGDSNDSDDDRRKKKKTSISIPSISTNSNEKSHDNYMAAHGSNSDSNDSDDSDSNEEEEDIHAQLQSHSHTFTIKSMKKSVQKKAFIPSLDRALINKGTNYDRNSNANYKPPTMSLTRPSSAKFGSTDKKQRVRVNRVESMRPDSARASGGDKKMLFAEEDLKQVDSEEEDSLTDSEVSSDSELDSDDEEELYNNKDMRVFRENINNGYMPKLNTISYNGLLNEYYFTEYRGNKVLNDDEKQCLFYASYSYARVDSNINMTNMFNMYHDSEEEVYDDIYGKVYDKYTHYLRINLNSNVKSENIHRHKLNLVILLDQSGSMGSTFNEDEVAMDQEIKSKMSIANECLCKMLDNLQDNDRFALISFDDEIYIHTQSKLQFVKDINTVCLKEKIINIRENGGTNFELAYEKASEFFNDLFHSNTSDINDYDNRVIMLTDACPNVSATDPQSLLHLFRKNCAINIYTTFIAIGLDFNTEMINEINIQRGCNYFSVKSSQDFKQILNNSEAFQCMLTPLVFNVCLTLKSETANQGNCIADVYGVNYQKRKLIKQSGAIQRIGTLFPTHCKKPQGNNPAAPVRGGMVIVKLKNNRQRDIAMAIKYEDRNGKIYETTQRISLGDKKGIYFDDVSIRKGVLLCRYCRLLKQWLEEDVDSRHIRSFLNVSSKWKNIFSSFIAFFRAEMDIIGDLDLEKEVILLNKLVSYNNNSSLKPNMCSTSSTSSVSPRTHTKIEGVTDLIISFLQLKDPRITWKMIEFLSTEPTTSILMSFMSRMSMAETVWMDNLQRDIDYNLCIDSVDFVLHSEDPNEIRLTQLSYSLMRMLSNDNYAETVKSFLSRKCAKIARHSLAVFHPLSRGNAYHARVILESLLHSNPKELFTALLSDKCMRQLLKCALFRNIQRGNMNSFFLDLICFKSQSRQKLYKQQTEMNHKKLLKLLSEWNIVPYILRQSASARNDDNVCGKFCSFFIDLTAKSATMQECKILFPDKYATLIVDELVGNGLLNNKTSVWTKIQCSQSLIQFLDICSRPTILDQQQQQQLQLHTQLQAPELNEYPNIFYSLFEPLLDKLHSFMQQLADAVVFRPNKGAENESFGQFRLNCLELLTVAADFAQFDCGTALAKIPILFFKSLLDLAFIHERNNFFLVHFRRLIHLCMIFRRRILKILFLSENMLIRLINYYNSNEYKHTDLCAYIVQMLFDFYDHDKLSLEKAEQKNKQHAPLIDVVSGNSSSDSYDASSDEEEEEEELQANYSDEVEDQWSIAQYFDSVDLWQSFKLTVIEEIDAQTTFIADVPNWDMGQSSKLDDLISSLLRREEDETEEDDGEPFRNKIYSGLMPSLSSVSYFNVLNEYKFNLQQNKRILNSDNNKELLCYPSFSFAKCKIKNVLVRNHDENDDDYKGDIGNNMKYFVAVDLNIHSELLNKKRNKLNLVIVLDWSESMGHCWNDSDGIIKIDYAMKGIGNILSTLNGDDRIGIITFDNHGINIHQHLELVSAINCEALINKLNPGPSINNNCKNNQNMNSMDVSAMKSGIDFESAFISSTDIFSKLFDKFRDASNNYDNRIIFISDYIPQSMSFINLIKNCSEDINERICTSFISVGGCEYNSLFISHLLRNRGCNYYCPQSAEIFLELTTNKNNKFDDIVTPLIYDLCLNLKSSQKDKRNTINCFNHIYGIKNEKKQKLLIQSGEIYKNYTLFLSHEKQENSIRNGGKNGIILIELNNKLLINNNKFNICVEMSFEDRDGRWYEFNHNLILKIDDNNNNNDYFDNIGIRKSILIYRYIKIIKQRIEDDPKINDSNSIESTKWKTKLKKFINYFQKEINYCNDKQLLNELNVLHKLTNFND